MICFDPPRTEGGGLRPRIRDGLTVLLALGAVPLVRVALSLLGLSRVRRRLERAGGGEDSRSELPAARARRVHALVVRAARAWPGTTCLPVALITRWLLGREGFAAQLRLGVRTSPAGIDAHAWVECAGVDVGMRPGEGFAPLPPGRSPCAGAAR